VADGDPARVTIRLLLDPALGAAAGGWCGRAKAAAIDVVFASGADPAALQAAEAACRTGGAGPPQVLPPAPAVADQWAAPRREADAGRALTAGEKADFVLLAAPPEADGAMKVRSTWVGGREVYRRPG